MPKTEKYTYTLERIIDEEFDKIKNAPVSDLKKRLAEAKKTIRKEFYRYVEQRDRAQAAAVKNIKSKLKQIDKTS